MTTGFMSFRILSQSESDGGFIERTVDWMSGKVGCVNNLKISFEYFGGFDLI